MTVEATGPDDVGVKTIDASLRLWSDEVELDPLVDALGAETSVLHIKGRPIATRGRGVPRLAKRHFASLKIQRGDNWPAVEAQIEKIVRTLAQRREIASLLASAHIEAVIWIALLGDRKMSEPSVEPRLVTAVAALGASIFIENYTDLENGNPKTFWLPERVAA